MIFLISIAHKKSPACKTCRENNALRIKKQKAPTQGDEVVGETPKDSELSSLK